MSVQALHIACFKGAAAQVRLLLKAGADVRALAASPIKPANFSIQGEGATCLMRAACGNRAALIPVLVAAGADVNFTVVEDGIAETALTLAAKYNAAEAFQALLAAGADASREANYVALCYGANSNNFAVVRFMLAAGAPVDYEAGASLVPLARAVMQRHTQMVHYLIEQGADVNRAFPVCYMIEQRASVALEQASLRSSVYSCTDNAILARPVSAAVLQALLEAGADVHYTNSDGVTALHCLLARPAACVEAIELLAQHGADVNACDHLGSELWLQQAPTVAA